ncbi:MAG: adenosylcobalamin-dependent ribonucleoside-diphosphate reductase [Candidatus Woesearchaeota archaeon]
MTEKILEEICKDCKDKPVLIEISKSNCRFCEEIEPEIEKIRKEYGDQICIKQINIGEYPTLFNYFNIGANYGFPIIVILDENMNVVKKFPGIKIKLGNNEKNVMDAETIIKIANKSLGTTPKQNIETLTENKELCSSCNIKEDYYNTSLNISANGLKVLAKRYLKRDENGNVIEKPEEMFLRVAKTIAAADKYYGATDDEVKKTTETFYNLMTELYFLPNSPTLMNAGRELGQLSACFVLPVYDDTTQIFEQLKNTALIHKSGGGTGFSFSRLRPRNDIVKKTSGVASGPVSFMYIYNQATETMKQGGTRRGANMGILRVDHPDIVDFINSKAISNEKNAQILEKIEKIFPLKKIMGDNYKLIERILIESNQLNNFNISVALTDKFMEAVKENKNYTLVNPRNKKKIKEINARNIFDLIINRAWQNGEPGVIFIDRINKYNPTPHLGEIESTNPCGEQPLLPYESCNLGSINLAKIVKEEKIDYPLLEKIVKESVHFLDNVIDVNKFPLPEVEEITKKNRKIGLGVMGFADMLIQLQIPYDSDKAIDIAEEVMKFIRDKGREASIELAEKRGTFPEWEKSIYNKDSPYFKGEHLRLRNATITTIAPTGTIAMIADVSSGIEPLIALSAVKNVMDGTAIKTINPYFEKIAKEKGFYSEDIMQEIIKNGSVKDIKGLPEGIKRIFKIAGEISPEQHIKIQAAFQKYTDNAVSKTINLPTEATPQDIEKAYMLAYELGCKGVTVYRNNSRETQVYQIGENKAIEEIGNKYYKRQKTAIATVRQENIGIQGENKKIYITKTFRLPQKQEEAILKLLKKEGTPYEIFINANFFDNETSGAIAAFAISASKRLRSGTTTPEEIAEEIQNLPGGEPTVDNGFGPEKSYINRSIWDGIGKALKDFEPPTKSTGEIKKEKPEREKKNFGYCNNCGNYSVVHEEGCQHCINCGYSEKGCT